MTTHPITLTPSQLRAALAGRLEQARMPVEPQPEHKQLHEHNGVVIHDSEHRMWCWKDLVLENIWDFPDGEDRKTLASRCPWGVVGDRLYIQEDYDLVDDPGTDRPVRKTWDKEEKRSIYWAVDYKIDGGTRIMDKLGQRVWRDACTMPKWASRFAFDIVGIRVERDDAGVWCWVIDVRKVGE